MKVEMSSKNKKIALLGAAVFIVLAVLIVLLGMNISKSGNLTADANTAIGALKAQIVNLKARPKTIDLTVNEAYAVSTDTDVSLSLLSKEDASAIFGASSDEDNPAVSGVIKAETLVYFSYNAMEYASMDDKSNGEKLGGDKFLAYICEDDVIVVIANAAEDGTFVTTSEEGLKEAIIKYSNTGIASITYVPLTEDKTAQLVDMPTDFSGWTQLDVAELNDYIAIDYLD